MNIGFIGAGKAGVSLGRYFTEGGLNLKGYYSRSHASAQDAARFTDSEAFTDMEALTDECDVIFLTVPDSQIPQVWQQIREYEIRDKIICHCSGALSSKDAFTGIEGTGAFGYSVHPLFAVSDKYNAYRELTDVFFTLEGPAEQSGENSPAEQPCREMRQSALSLLREMLEKLGNPVGVIRPEDKAVYHCASAIASNLACGLVDLSMELMERCGFTEESALAALRPILTGNMAHIAQRGPVDSLTGPIERNDAATVKKHLACFQDDDQREVYRLLSGRLVKMAQRRHPDGDYTGMWQQLRKDDEI